MDWVDSLKNHVKTTTNINSSMVLKSPVSKTLCNPQYKIPHLTSKKKPQNPVDHLVEASAFKLLLSEKKKEILTPKDLDQIWNLLSLHSLPKQSSTGDPSPSIENEQISQTIDYDSICLIASHFSKSVQPLFSPSAFLKFQSNENGHISIQPYFNYILRKSSLLQARLDLTQYDQDHDGFLLEQELQQYISDLIPSLNLQNLNKSFHRFYLCTAIRKFFFFLDNHRRGKISIKDVLLSPILTEFFELRQPGLPQQYLKSNWFSPHSTLRVYGQFLTLDLDRNGLLNRQELSQYLNGCLTDVFLDRVFQETQTYGGEMDYQAYLDFVLAMENLRSPASISYCFRLLDINGQGYLDEFTISYFFKAVVEKLQILNQPVVNVEDVTNEIMDMVNSENRSQITLSSLIKSQVGGTVISLLINVNGFQTYDNSM